MIYKYIKQYILCALALLLLLGLVGCDDSSDGSAQSVVVVKETIPSWQEQYDFGVCAISEGNYEKGIEALKSAIEIDPTQISTYRILAESYIKLNDYDNAIEILEQGIKNTENELLSDMLANAKTDLSSIVTDAYSHTYTGEVGDTYEWHVPRIELAGSEISSINDEILMNCGDFVQDTIALAETGIMYPVGVSYEWAINENILSLHIIEFDFSYSSHYVYNISILDGTKMSDEELVSYAGFSVDDYYERAEQVMGSHFWNECGSLVRTNEDIEELKKTISRENVEAALPYLDSEGQLYIVAHIYPPIEVPDYWIALNMVAFNLVPDYAERADSSSVSQPSVPNTSANAEPQSIQNISAEAAQIIAYQYWGVDPDEAAKSGSDINPSFENAVWELNGKKYYCFERYGVGTADYVWATQNEDVWCIFIDAITGECFISIPN